ncbi:uncharacterized protein AMSG_09076, partial [Thecamonas trahens ATCC 50062]
TAAPAAWPSSVDIVESESRVLVFLDLPGMSSSAFKVEYAANSPAGPPGGTLSVSGVRTRPALQGKFRVISSSRFAGPFAQHITIPLQVEPATLKASYRDGVLLIRIRKAAAVAAAKPAIKLNFGGNAGH